MISMLESAEKGKGLYSFREVAHYLGINTSTLYSWFFPSGNRTKLLDPSVLKTDADGAWLSFDDFLQAYAVRWLKSKGFKPRKVREAIDQAKEQYGLPYPLSVKGHVVYTGKRGRIYIKPPGEPFPVELIGRGKRQRVFTTVEEPYMERLEFDEHGLATKFIVHQETFGAHRFRVVMDPHTNFGEPTLEGTPYRSETLKRAVEAEGSVADVARIYEIEESAVLVALHAKEAEFQDAA